MCSFYNQCIWVGHFSFFHSSIREQDPGSLTHCWCHLSWDFSQGYPHHSYIHPHRLQRTCPSHCLLSHSCQLVTCFPAERQQLDAEALCTWTWRGPCGWTDWYRCEDNLRPGREHPQLEVGDMPGPASRSWGWDGLSSSVWSFHSLLLSRCCQMLSPGCCQIKRRSNATMVHMEPLTMKVQDRKDRIHSYFLAECYFQESQIIHS